MLYTVKCYIPENKHHGSQHSLRQVFEKKTNKFKIRPQYCATLSLQEIVVGDGPYVFKNLTCLVTSRRPLEFYDSN